MTLFFHEPARVVVQGVTGREARMVVRHMQAYGTDVTAGVTPGKGGLEVEGVPVSPRRLACSSSLRGLGVSTAVSVGGDAMIGTSPAELLRRFRADPETELVLYVGEPGTRLEEDLAAFGHAAAVIGRSRGRPSDKMRALMDAGALVADSFDDLFRLAESAIGTETRR